MGSICGGLPGEGQGGGGRQAGPQLSSHLGPTGGPRASSREGLSPVAGAGQQMGEGQAEFPAQVGVSKGQ